MENDQPLHINMLKTVAIGLQELNDEVVYVGGATVGLYSTVESSTEVRHTEDVDCVIEVASRKEFNKVEERLRELGFSNDTSAGAPICRYRFKGVIVDVMPTDPELLGFANKWYKAGMLNTQLYELPGGPSIHLLLAPYFIATKLEALFDRGIKDIRTSPDFEDIIYVIDNRKELVDEITAADNEVKTYLASRFGELLAHSEINEAIEGALDFASRGREARTRGVMEAIAALEK
jgi:predicted nucleotidyltransferase